MPAMERVSGCAVVIPARDEAGAIAAVVSAARQVVAGDVVVVDNGSRDATASVAAAAGARVVQCARRGYGHACFAGLAVLPDAAVVVFVDGDGSMSASDIPRLVMPIVEG